MDEDEKAFSYMVTGFRAILLLSASGLDVSASLLLDPISWRRRRIWLWSVGEDWQPLGHPPAAPPRLGLQRLEDARDSVSVHLHLGAGPHCPRPSVGPRHVVTLPQAPGL